MDIIVDEYIKVRSGWLLQHHLVTLSYSFPRRWNVCNTWVFPESSCAQISWLVGRGPYIG